MMVPAWCLCVSEEFPQKDDDYDESHVMLHVNCWCLYFVELLWELRQQNGPPLRNLEGDRNLTDNTTESALVFVFFVFLFLQPHMYSWVFFVSRLVWICWDPYPWAKKKGGQHFQRLFERLRNMRKTRGLWDWGEEAGAQEKWMKATGTEAFYVCLDDIRSITWLSCWAEGISLTLFQIGLKCASEVRHSGGIIYIYIYKCRKEASSSSRSSCPNVELLSDVILLLFLWYRMDFPLFFQWFCLITYESFCNW